MEIILTLILYILSLSIIGLVLIQPHKSEGIASLKSDSTIFGVSTDGGPLPKLTAVIAIILAIVILSLNYYYK